MVVGRDDCRDLEIASKLEWLEADGTGGFAMGTVAGINIRRYHGLLVAALRPPVERHVLLSRVEEEVDFDGHVFALGAAQYPGVVTPDGFQYLEEFRLDPGHGTALDAVQELRPESEGRSEHHDGESRQRPRSMYDEPPRTAAKH